MVVTAFTTNCSGVSFHRLPFYVHSHNWSRFKDRTAIQLHSGRMLDARIQHLRKDFCIKHTLSAGKSCHQMNISDEFSKEPFWLNLVKQAFQDLKSLSLFLVEQPTQLKYIEWPSFQSTLKTATLTLVLVALLIVALSSTDAALCFLLALFLRRSS